MLRSLTTTSCAPLVAVWEIGALMSTVTFAPVASEEADLELRVVSKKLPDPFGNADGLLW